MLERGINVDHSTLNRLVVEYAPIMTVMEKDKLLCIVATYISRTYYLNLGLYSDIILSCLKGIVLRLDFIFSFMILYVNNS